MVKNLIVRLIIQHGPKVLRSAFNAYKEVNKNGPKTNANDSTNNNNNTNNNSEGNNEDDKNNKNSSSGVFGRFSMQNLISSPMSKQEALKILDLNSKENITYSDIINKSEKLIELNNPEKGGSFYLQNKVFYAKEFLIEEYPPTEEELKKKDDEESKKEENKEELNNNKNDKI